MKRILCLALFICSLASSCFAFDPPQPPRWHWVGSDSEIGIWIDKDTSKWEVDRQGWWGHKGHTLVTVWIMYYQASTNSHSLEFGRWCLNCRSNIQFKYVKYDSNGNCIKQGTYYPQTEELVIPNSWGEEILNSLKIIWNNKQ